MSSLELHPRFQGPLLALVAVFLSRMAATANTTGWQHNGAEVLTLAGLVSATSGAIPVGTDWATVLERGR